MSIQLRNTNKDSFVYIENTTGSVAMGTDGDDNQILKIVNGLTGDISPGSTAASISIDPRVNGNISFLPKGTTGESIFINGDVSITADSGGGPGTGLGNLNLENTKIGGTAGVINYGSNRFIHDYGTSNTFVGETAGNFSLTPANSRFNTGIGFSSLISINGLGGESNTAVGSESLTAMTTGNENTAVGRTALNLVTTGNNNTAIGFTALSNLNSSGSNNTVLGSNAAVSLTGTDSNNIIIGQGVTGTIGDNRTIRIGKTSGGTSQTKCFIAGINGTSVTAAGSVVIDASGQLGTISSFSTIWNDVTGTSASMAVNNGYVADNAGLVTLTLPTTAAFGSRFEIVGKGSGGWTIAQNIGQTVHFNSSNTTTGVGGSLSSTQRYNCVELICVTANADFVVKDSSGNLTVV